MLRLSKRASKVAEQDQDDDDRDEDLLPKRRRERVERLVDQLGPVVERDDGDLADRSVLERSPG